METEIHSSPEILRHTESTKNYYRSHTLSLIAQFIFGGLAKIITRLFWAKVVVKTKTDLVNCPLPVLMVANHKSYYDSMVINSSLPLFSSLRPIRFMSADRFFVSPIFRYIFTLVGSYPAFYKAGIERSLRIPDMLLKQGRFVQLFPEGRCVRDDTIGGGKMGAATLALANPNVYILPAGIARSYTVRWRLFVVPIIQIHYGELFRLNEKYPSADTPEAITEVIMAEIATLHEAALQSKV